MTAPAEAPDPVDAHVAALSGLLRGPRRLTTRMLDELRDGLTDAVAAHRRDGVPPRRAAELAVRAFGAPEELAPAFQRELTIAQARRTARSAALAVPFAAACWLLLRTAGSGAWAATSGASHALALTSGLLLGVAAAASALAGVGLALSGPLGRRLPTPARLPSMVAWAGTAAGLALAGATVALALLALLGATWPAAVAAGAVAAASHGVVASSARACRRCARLPVQPVHT
ncbi:hypothetical protein GCM10023347_03200 [Streptomyces chumphonensis]|uniref:Uncharacterized protein n=1 Tax=Streptomyces chumphonensis TaxID=1214925 RepID=A0A927F3M2_9ACTN|nr:permease prefix domain 1-containing protein [Streptomyces chumphonensis]MBD3934929.1 hypothetical protein [Streptomyces chumphonensis]